MALAAFLLLPLLHIAQATIYDDYEYEEEDEYKEPVNFQFVVEPLTLTVNEGDMIRLPCMVDRFDQFPLLMWKKDSSVLAIGEKILFPRLFLESVNNGIILHIPNATPSDEEEYTCQIASSTTKDLRPG